MPPSIAYHARAGVGEAKDDDIIEFPDSHYPGLGRWGHLDDGDDFPKESLTASRILQSCKSVLMATAPVFAYPLEATRSSSFVPFTLFRFKLQ